MKRKGSERRDKIIQVSVTLFEKKGFRSTTMREIAKKTGLNQGSLYYYFKSKSDILYEIYLQMMKGILEDENKLANLKISEDEKIKVIINDIINLIGTQKALTTVVYREHISLSPIHLKSLQKSSKGYRSVLEKIFIDGVKKGIFKSLDPGIVTLALVGMCNWAYMWLNQNGSVSLKEISKLFSEVFLEGIRKREETS